MLVNFRVRASETRLEGRVQQAQLSPVGIQSPHLSAVKTRVLLGTLQRSQNGTDAGLGGHSGQAVSGSVNGISTSLSAGNHGRHTSTSRVVGVDVDRKVGVTLADTTDQQTSSLRLQNTSHILDTKDMGLERNDLVDQAEVVFEVVLLRWVEHVTAVADGSLDNTSSGVNCLDTDLKLVDVVEGIEDTEDIDTASLCLLTEMVDGVVGKGRVGNTIGTAEKHLEGNVGNSLAHLAQTVPGVLVQEAHGDIESRATPALKTVGVGEGVAGLVRDVQQINGTNTGSEQRLVGITPGGVHDQATLVGTHGLGPSLGALLVKDLLPALSGGRRDIERLAGSVVEDRLDNVALEFGLADLALDAATVHGDIAQVSEQLLSTVLTTDQGKQFGGIINESGPAGAISESGVAKQRGQERNVGLDTTNTELDQGTNDLAASNFISGSTASTFDQHGVIVRCDNGTSETVTTVETDTVTTSGTIHLDLTSIRRETLGGIFGGDTALDSKAASGDAVLGQAELLQSSTSSDLNLSSNNIDASDFLSNGVFDLDTRVDFNEVVAVLLVDQELGSTGVAVVDGLSQLHGIGKDTITDINRQTLCGGDLNDLLVTTLNRAVTLEEVNNVSVVVTQQLDLNMLGLVEEALDEDCAVPERRASFRGSTLKRVPQISLATDNAHTTATTTKGSLDNNGEAIRVSEGLDFLIAFDRALGTGDNGDIGLDSHPTGRDLVT